MKFCTKCGHELVDEAVICTNCGCATGDYKPAQASGSYGSSKSGLKTAAKVLMIVGTVLTSLYGLGIPLAWCLPMTLSYCKKIKNGEPVSTGFKVCSLLFVSMVGGILMLCDND